MAEMEETYEMAEEKVSKLKRIKGIFKSITIEPVALLMLTGMMMSSNVTQTLILEKACRVDLQLPVEACDALRNQDTDNNTEIERQVQEYVSQFVSYRSIISSGLPFIWLLFAGGWMDLTGRRKVLMLLPVIGQTLNESSNIINVVFFNQLNVKVLMFSDSILTNIFGGWSVLFLSLFTYIVDITTEKNRTYRLGLVSFAVYIGMPVGVSLSGVFLKNFGYLSVYITALCMNCINGLYLIFTLSDPARTLEHKTHDNRGCIYLMRSFFNPAHFLNSLKIVFKKTATNRRMMLIMLILTSCFIFTTTYGESAIKYLSTRYRFNWDELQFSMFQALNMIVTTVGNMFAILFLSKYLGWHDSILGVMSLTSKIAASLLYCFAPNGTVFFIGPFVDMLDGTATIALRSLLTKTVEHHEISRLNSITSIFEVLLPIAVVPSYVKIYTSSMGWMPGFVFLISVLFSIPPLLVFMWLFYRHRKSVNREEMIKYETED